MTSTEPESLVMVVFAARIPEFELLPLPASPDTETLPPPAALIVADLKSRPRFPEPVALLLDVPTMVTSPLPFACRLVPRKITPTLLDLLPFAVPVTCSVIAPALTKVAF